LTQADLASPKNHCRVIADISCDINGPIASTLRSSSIADPEYGYNPSTGEETEFTHPDSIAVMAIDNLPCALPRDASEDFGNEWIKNVLPHLLQDSEHIIENATETKNGALTPPFEYLADYAAQP
jgi:saccharopine dehydrogenase (NAD+, L-lysine-forming)